MADTDYTPVELAHVYAGYMAQDYARDIMNHLKGSYPLEREELQSFLAGKIDGEVFQMGNTGTINRFLYECAEHVLSEGANDPGSRQCWEEVSALPSLHHDEIAQIIYQNADLYRRTTDQTLLGVVVNDAGVAAQTIAQKAASRLASEETGGELQLFNWGILNDGMWLNNALMRAYDMASIFRPGDQTVAYYATTAFDFSRKYSTVTALNDQGLMHASSELHLLLSSIGEDQLEPLLKTVSQEDLTDILFTIGHLNRGVERWKLALTDIQYVVGSVRYLSVLARLTEYLTHAVSSQEDDTLISDFVKDRIHEVNNCATLLLTGFEALRETKFAETLIMIVKGEGDDPKVEVVVNNDLMNGYHSAGGVDADLVRFGLHLDPRKGMPTPNVGWSLQHILSRKEEVVAEIISQDAERLEKMRNNDAAQIQNLAFEVITQLAKSYIEARHLDYIRPDISQHIVWLSRDISNPDLNIDVLSKIANILIMIIDDPLLTSIHTNFMANIQPESPIPANKAAAFAVAETALDDFKQVVTAGE